jgi:Holliday junction resolvase RusA-like endonuclease
MSTAGARLIAAAREISTLDPPFLAPLECVMDLPFPPSTNEIWRGTGKRVVLSHTYRVWKAQADLGVVANGCWRHRVRMPAHFRATILLSSAERTARRDGDNRIKAVLDWAQTRELIVNDALCDGGNWDWVAPADAPRGCRLILRSVA